MGIRCWLLAHPWRHVDGVIWQCPRCKIISPGATLYLRNTATGKITPMKGAARPGPDVLRDDPPLPDYGYIADLHAGAGD